jgi:hypothetical protein
MAITYSSRIQSRLTPPELPRSFERNHGGILDPGGLTAIIARPEPAGLFYLERFPGEGPGQSSSPMPVITRQWNRMSAAYICQTCRSFHRRLDDVVVKNGGNIK